ncbi:MAG: leucyl aminopeptidase [Bacteroidales bacterium]|nr:leucyl aminopeptidase [Bacteroidales bacterium]
MITQLYKATEIPGDKSQVLLLKNEDQLKEDWLKKEELEYIRNHKEKLEKKRFAFNRFDRWMYVQFLDDSEEAHKRLEKNRQAGNSLLSHINGNKLAEIYITDHSGEAKEALAFAEGMLLGNYQFLKYFKEAEKKQNTLQKVFMVSKKLSEKDIEELNITTESTWKCRDLVNEPLSSLNAVKLGKAFEAMAREAGIHVEVMNKKKIESLKMGGLLSVNKGSIDPPTFTIMEWKPEGAVNEKPIVLVGKGVTYDTGGMSLKPSSGMHDMKCDMAGAATMGSVMYAVAKNKLPVHVVALMPATDNRPDGNAYVPGDIIKMYDGTTVEVLNTDAEGRLIMADALSYAKKFEPQLVMDMATLTGSAKIAIGSQGIIAMGSKSNREMDELTEVGSMVHERIAKFPFWEEYSEMLKSEVADLKNIGGREAGAITAGKFLEHFTDYPYIHMDIAAPAFLDKKDSYRGIGGTGMGVRLLYHYIKRLTKK